MRFSQNHPGYGARRGLFSRNAPTTGTAACINFLALGAMRSRRRKQAVAGALAEERPDLQLTVAGFGDSNPAEDEDEKDPSTFTANRRVEIRYG